MNPQRIREPRDQARAEYEQATKGLSFTKDFQSRQEALMHDPLATVGERVMAAILRRSWGEFRLYAVKSDGEPYHQRDCVRELALSKGQVSTAVSYYQKRGYLEKKGKLLYPVISPALTTPKKVTDSRNFSTFMDEWKVTYSSDFEEEKVLRSRLKQKIKVRLSAYKKWLKSQQSAPVSLCIESKKIKEESPSSSSAVQTLPLPEQKAEEEEPSLYQKFKTRYPADHYDEAKAKPFFDNRTREQQLYILERLAVYLSCDRWKDEDGRWIPLASNWLPACDADPPPVMKKAPAKQSTKDAVIEEAKRRYAKYGRI